jgi:hypothetical protein
MDPPSGGGAWTSAGGNGSSSERRAPVATVGGRRADGQMAASEGRSTVSGRAAVATVVAGVVRVKSGHGSGACGHKRVVILANLRRPGSDRRKLFLIYVSQRVAIVS